MSPVSGTQSLTSRRSCCPWGGDHCVAMTKRCVNINEALEMALGSGPTLNKSINANDHHHLHLHHYRDYYYYYYLSSLKLQTTFKELIQG